MTEGSLNRPEAPALGRPDPFDRLLERLGAAPIDPWLLGIVAALSLMAAGHVFVWASGGLEPGRTNRLLLASAVYGPYALAALLYLRRVARRSLERFWPATGWPVEEMPRWRAAFATGPARIGLPALMFGVVVGVGSTLGAAPGSLAPTEAESRAVIPVLIPISIIGYGAFPIVVAQTVRHLRLVSRIHREAGAIDPFDTRTVHAFSVLTSQIGLAFVAIGYFSLTVNGAFQAGNPIALGVLGTSFAIGTACFVAPLWGIHQRLVAEKERRSAEIEQRADRLAAELYRRIDGDAVASSKEVGDALAALGAVRDRIARLPTWPWPPQLLRGFISALVIPAVVYVLGRLLAQQMAL